MIKKRKIKAFDVINSIILILLTLITVYPLLSILAVSLSHSLYADQVILLPKKFTFDSYLFIFKKVDFWNAMGISVIRTIVGPIVNMLFTIFAAYALSKPHHRFHCRTMYAWFLFISMIFGGGVVPWYVMISEVGLLDNFWALILPGAVPVFNIIVLLNFFREIPAEMEEAAIMDGTSQARILLQIYLPLSKASIATIALFSIVGHWNAWFDGLVLMDTPEKLPLQSYLQTIVIKMPQQSGGADAFDQYDSINQKTTNAAQIFIAMIPILAIYPFLQKYFAKGLLVGGVKG